MARTTYLTFYIVLTDPDLVAAYQALYPRGVNRAPYNAAVPGGAAVEFAAPWTNWRLLPGGPPPPQAPYTWSPWSSAVVSGHPFPIDVATFTRHTGGFWGIGGTTVRYYWVGEFVYAGADAAPPGGEEDAAAPDLEYAPIAPRRFIDGFEVPLAGPGISTNFVTSLDAGRAVGSRGLPLRGQTNEFASVAPSKYRALTTSNGWDRLYIRLRRVNATGPVSFWSTRGASVAADGVALFITPSAQLAVYNTASAGQSLLATIDPPLPIWSGLGTEDAWRRLDLLYEYGNHVTGYFRVFIDGALAAAFAIPATGLGNSATVQSTILGEQFSVGSNTLELDVDTWVVADLPPGQDSIATNGVGRPYLYDVTATYQVGDLVHTPDGHAYKAIAISTGVQPTPRSNGAYWHRYEGRDWIYGSRILLSKPKAFGANHSVNWTGNYRTLQQNGMSKTSVDAATLTSSTASAVAEAEMDTADLIDTEPNAIGAASMLVVVNSARGANSGQLGYNINSAGAVDAAIVELGTSGFNEVLYPGPASPTLIDVSPLQLRYIKGSSADAASVRHLSAQIELLGTFSRSDVRPTPEGGAWVAVSTYAIGDVVERKHVWYTAKSAVTAGRDPSDPANVASWEVLTLPTWPTFVGQHNAPYRRSAYVTGALAGPNAPFIVQGGTYAGNATFQDLTFRAPVNMIFVRPIAASMTSYLWWSTLEAGHIAFAQATAGLLTDATEDVTFVPSGGEDAQQKRYVVRITGNHAQVNANTVTYQYIAVMDPGARFLLNGAFTHRSSLTADAANALIDPTFLPDWAFLMVESLDAASGKTFYAHGPGTAAQSIVSITPAVVTSAIALAAGTLTSRSAFHGIPSTTLGLFAYGLWRRADGNNDPGQPGVVNLGTYTGDGSASRTINLAPASGRRPLLAFVFAESGSSAYRDPSHTTNTSALHTGASSTTAITGGGVDTISVGTTLNTNNVVYNYFVLFADATAGNGGWGVNGEYLPVEASPPASGPWPADPDPAEFDTGEEPEPEPEAPADEPDLSTACVAATQRLVNIALSKIGVSKVIADLVAENTMEAALARLHIKPDVDAVLADFPWPFATRYANLVLVAGSESTPANVDWVYSYRAPLDMVAARRLGGQLYERRAWDPNPFTFRVGSDATGALIYSNAAIATGVPLVLEYTARVSCPASTGSALFKDALAWRFAASLAMPLARDSQKQAQCLAMYERVLAQAEAVAANESQQDKRGDAEWIEGRN